MKKYKLLKRFLKEKGQYQDFVRWAKKNEKDFFGDKDEQVVYALYAGGLSDRLNDFITYLTNNVIGKDKAFNIFKTYIEKKYGVDVLNNYLTNLNPTFIKKEAQYVDVKIKNTLKTKKDVINAVKEFTLVGFLFYTFEWSKTPQGHKYWRDINYQWNDDIGKLIDNDFNIDII